jgi:thermitase
MILSISMILLTSELQLINAKNARTFGFQGTASELHVQSSSREIIVKFGPHVNLAPKPQFLENLNNRFRTEELKRVFENANSDFSTIFKIRFSKEVDLKIVLTDFNSDPNVVYAEPNYVMHTTVVPNDVEYIRQWAHQKMESENAWAIQKGDPNTTIAIIDTGVDWDHPDLAANIWMNLNETLNGFDDDENGFIDDIRGWDFVNVSDPVWPGEDGSVRDNDPMDFHGHGTHVAGIAAAKTNNTLGIAGTSWNSKIMAVRAGYMNSSGYGELQLSDIAPAIKYATDEGANVISMSFGDYNFSSLLKEAVDYAHAKGVVMVAAAGNEDTDEILYPAGYGNVTAVAATNNLDGKASFSNYGSWIEVAAPGVNIYSTMFDDGYGSWSGTSMATPYVAGLAGLIISENTTLTNEEVRHIIRNTTDPLSTSEYIGTGRINAFQAIRMAYVTRTWIVDDDEPADFHTIQEAINTAYNNDTILVNNGTYYENVVVDKSLSIIGENQDTTIINGPEMGFTILADNVHLSGFTIHDSSYAINILSVENITINNNLIANITHDGIIIDGKNHVLSHNIIMECSTGIIIHGRNITVKQNTLLNNRGFSIHLSNGSNNNILLENNLTQNLGLGFYLQSTDNNFISRNWLINNEEGIRLTSSKGNVIYHNNLINNTVQAYLTNENSNNTWDNGCEGNHWTNYNGTDLGEDGIGDEYLPWEDVDYHPLMSLYWAPVDINHDLRVDMRDVGRAARAFGTEPDDERWNCHADITGPVPLKPDNLVDMRDIGLIASYFGDEYS